MLITQPLTSRPDILALTSLLCFICFSYGEQLIPGPIELSGNVMSSRLSPKVVRHRGLPLGTHTSLGTDASGSGTGRTVCMKEEVETGGQRRSPDPHPDFLPRCGVCILGLGSGLFYRGQVPGLHCDFNPPPAALFRGKQVESCDSGPTRSNPKLMYFRSSPPAKEGHSLHRPRA